VSEQLIWSLCRGVLATRALGVAADLRVADDLADGPKRIDDDFTYRILRALASDGVFEEIEPRVFRNNEASELLRTSGWRDLAHFFGGVWLQAIGELDADAVAPFPRVFGTDFWSWLGAHPEERAAFDRAMADGKERAVERLAEVEWRGDETVVDVGGGTGSLLRALLEREHGLTGIVFDLPETTRDESTFGDGLTFVAGDFFDSVPPADAYVLQSVLHDWDDEHALAILRTVRAAARDETRLLLLEDVVGPGDESAGAKWLDLLMLVIAGGRERDADEWRALLEAGGWGIVEVHPGLIEARCL
jgi:O-methyltransferase domain